MDKTGTLTEGKPTLVTVAPAAGWDEPTLLRLAASLERGSEHPLAAAIGERDRTAVTGAFIPGGLESVDRRQRRARGRWPGRIVDLGAVREVSWVCHVVLSLPILGLVLFVIFPLPVAAPLYLIVVIVSALMYAAIWRALRLPPSTGLEAMTGGRARVVEALHPAGVIRYHGEFWRAVADEPVDQGTRVWITGVERRPEGLTAVVCRTPSPQGPDGLPSRACH